MSTASNRFLGICLAAGLCSWGIAATAWPAGMEQPKVEYSADQTISGQGQTFQSKVYHARDKERMEIRAGGSDQVIITRIDKKLSWVLMPEQKAYMELSLDQPRGNAPKDIRECSMTMKSAGTETVNGHSATRNDVEATCPDASRYKGSIWITRDGIAVKIDATAQGGSGEGSRILVELKNLKIAKQQPSLFEVPAGYSKFSIPDMGGSMGGLAAPQAPPQPERRAPEVPAPPAAGKKRSTESGRSYTATGRSYTAQPRSSEEAGQGTVDKAIGAGKKLKSLFGW